MTKTIRQLDPTVTVVNTMVVPTAPTSGADTKTSISQLTTYLDANIQLPSTAKVTGLDTALNSKVVGPSSAVNNNLASFDTTTGKLIKDSGISSSSVGNVVGPASATGTALVRFDGTTGKLVKNSTTILNDSGNMTVNGTLTSTSTLSAPTTSFTVMNATTANISAKLNIPNYSLSAVYVSINGDDTYSGQIINPKLNIVNADASALINTSIFVDPGTYTGGQFLKTTFVGLYGSSPEDCSFTSSGLLGIGNGQWIVSTSPNFAIHDITLVGTDTSYFPSVYVADSTQVFSNVNWSVNQFKGGLVTNLILKNGCFCNGSIDLKDVPNAILTDGAAAGMHLESIDSTSVPVNTIIINNYDFRGYSIALRTGYDGTGSFAVKITNCRNISDIQYDDNSALISSNLEIDASSWPTNGINDFSGGGLAITKTTNVANGVDTSSGFALGSSSFNNFFWTGANSAYPSNNDSFVCGHGAHITNGSDNILLGRYATSNYSGCFVWADNTATALANYFPSAANQFVVWPSGGFGVGTYTSGAAGPQAGFHYGNNGGNDGKILLSANGAVLDAKFHNLEMNPNIVGDVLGIKWSGSTGTLHNVFFPTTGTLVNTAVTTLSSLAITESQVTNLTSDLALKAPLASPTFTGTANFSGIKATSYITSTARILEANTVSTPYSAASVTLSASDMVDGIILTNPTVAQTAQLPTASDMDTAASAAFGTVPVNAVVEFTIDNISTTALAVTTLTPNTNFSIVTENGAPTIAISSCKRYKARKDSNTPTYVLFGGG